MSKMYSIPTRDNTIMKVEEVQIRPVFVNKTVAAEMFGVSKSTIYRWLDEADGTSEWEGLSIRPSATVTLIHLETMERFLRSRDKEFL